MPVSFEIDRSAFFKEIFDREVPRDLCAILSHLLGIVPAEALEKLSGGLPLAGRHAPSMVTRNEAELFGLSAPRFAGRLRLTNQYTFFNLRRLPSFLTAVRQQLENTHRDKPDHHDTLDQFCKSMKDLCGVADCIIELPEKYQTDKFTVLTTSLWKEFGEVHDIVDRPRSHGIPFVKHAPLGGGQCAPACSWMVTAILSNHATNLHGLTDVNFLAKVKPGPQPPKTSIILGQLTTRRLARYFVQAAGLRMASCSVQTTERPRTPLLSEAGIMKVASTFLSSGFHSRQLTQKIHQKRNPILQGSAISLQASRWQTSNLI